jgi:aryl-alcohol dehydrogenase-like predicted oxidoreductase
MGFAEGLGWGTGKEASAEVYRTFIEAGGNFIDTANTYGDGAAEEFLGELMTGHRDRVVLSTKYVGRFVGKDRPRDPNEAGSHRKSLVRAVESSLRRLRTDYIDLLWVHAWDYFTPVDEVLQGLDDAVRQGKILYTGVSNVPAWIVAQANTAARLRGRTPFVALQIEYNLLERQSDRELLPMAAAMGLGVTAWTPLASGLLTGKYADERGRPPADDGGPRRLDDPIMGRFAPRTERNLAIVEVVCRIAEDVGCRPSHVALNWLRHRGVIPIFGARTPGQVRENVACFEFALSEDHLRRLDDASKIKLGYPHDFLTSPVVKQFVYGGMHDVIDSTEHVGRPL